MSHVIYNLSKSPTTFDFAAWACIARTHGAQSVHFFLNGEIADWKYSKDIAWKRFANILLPICRVARLEYTFGPPIEGVEFPYLIGYANKLYIETGRLELLRPTMKVDRGGYVTLTMRQSFRNKWRNSNMEAWGKFEKYLSGKNIDVLVFPECEEEPMNLEKRMALYCAASMNLGVSNGPMALCLLSEAPYLTFNWFDNQHDATYDDVKLRAKQGFPVGSQLAFRNERQCLIYERDDYENIVRAYNEMMERKHEEVAA